MTVWKGRGHFLELFYVVLCTAVARSDSYTHEQFYRRLLVYQNLKKNRSMVFQAAGMLFYVLCFTAV